MASQVSLIGERRRREAGRAPFGKMRRMRLGLLGKALLALAVVGLAPLLIVPYLVTLNRDAMTDQVLSLHAVAAQSSASRVVAFLDPLRSAGQAAASNPLVTDDPHS